MGFTQKDLKGFWGWKRSGGRARSPHPHRADWTSAQGTCVPNKNKQRAVSVRTGFSCEKQRPKITRLPQDQTLSLFYIKAGKSAVQAWCGWLLSWVKFSGTWFPSSSLCPILRVPDVPRWQPIDPCSRKENGGRDKTDWGKGYIPALSFFPSDTVLIFN